MSTTLDALRGQISKEELAALQNELQRNDEVEKLKNRSSFTYRPNAPTGVALDDNEFADWAELMVALNAVSGKKEIYLNPDNTVIGTAPGNGNSYSFLIPAGNWDLSDTTIIFPQQSNIDPPWVFPPNLFLRMALADGCRLLKARRFVSLGVPARVISLSSSPVFDDFTTGFQTFWLIGNSMLICSDVGAAPAIQVPSGTFFFLQTREGATGLGNLGGGAQSPSLEILAGGQAELTPLNGMILDPNVITGTGVLTCEINFPVITSGSTPRFQIDKQSTFTGAVTIFPNRSSFAFTNRNSGQFANINWNGFLEADTTGGPVAASLPVALFHPGNVVAVKDVFGNALANPITVTPAVGDTVDGGASDVINTNFGAALYVSDGLNNWMKLV